MSASAVAVSSRMAWCVSRCGNVAVDGLYCDECAFRRELRSARMAVPRPRPSQPRVDLGSVPFVAQPVVAPAPRPSLGLRLALFFAFLVSVGLMLGGGVEAFHLGKLGIGWLCAHPL